MRGSKSSPPYKSDSVSLGGTETESDREISRIRVLIRVRPLNKEETAKKARNIIERQSDQQITVWDPACFTLASRLDVSQIDPSCWSRNFHFDKTLWSADKADKNYANQDVVYEVIGDPVLKLVLNGFNCCVFAYGQVQRSRSSP